MAPNMDYRSVGGRQPDTDERRHCHILVEAVVYIFFFFQAEDGIRDYKVTGVQTCALPISPASALHNIFNFMRISLCRQGTPQHGRALPLLIDPCTVGAACDEPVTARQQRDRKSSCRERV